MKSNVVSVSIFIIVVDYILRQSADMINYKRLTLEHSKPSRYPSRHLTDLDYADDISLLAGTIQNAGALLKSLENATHKVNLFLNTNGTKLKEVSDFKYIEITYQQQLKGLSNKKGSSMVPLQ